MPERTAKIDDALDRWLLHPVFGLSTLAVVMFLIFQAVYAWATPVMDLIEAGTTALGAWAGTMLPAGPLNSLLVDGIIAGVGGVLVFLPQILILFAFILALEESGYLPRAAFLLDRLMAGAGLSGRSFIPLLSSFACAIPGIMATRSIQDPRDRLATILVAPLMTCSARLPVYALLIGAFIPSREVWAGFNLQGWCCSRSTWPGSSARWRCVGDEEVAPRQRRAPADAGTALVPPAASARRPHRPVGTRADLPQARRRHHPRADHLLWFLLSFPAAPVDATMPAIDYSFAGRIGHAMTAVFAPLGFNWQICIALIPGLAAREVAVSSLATVYALSAVDDEAAAQALTPLITNGWSLATGLSLLVWFIYAPQCLATWAAIKRETGSWKTMATTSRWRWAEVERWHRACTRNTR
jgi:ferrous iron transport protein B